MRWKKKYERDARRKYKWPVLQILLQIAVMKLILRYRTVENKVLIENAISFLKIDTQDKDDSCLFEKCEELKILEVENEDSPFQASEATKNPTTLQLLPPCLTPFTSSSVVGKIKALKIFAIVKMELLKCVAPSRLKNR